MKRNQFDSEYNEFLNNNQISNQGELLLPLIIMLLEMIRQIKSEFERIAKLDWEQSIILAVLYTNKQSPLRVKDIVNTTNFGKSTVSNRLSRLEKSGSITYHDDPQDLRGVYISLTESGSSLAITVLKIVQDVLVDAFNSEQFYSLDDMPPSMAFNTFAQFSNIIQEQNTDNESLCQASCWYLLTYNKIYCEIKASLGNSRNPSLTAVLILMALRKSMQPMSSSQLILLLGVNKDLMTRSLRYLLNEEFVTRERDKLDRRIAFFELTTQGNELLFKIIPAVLKQITSLHSLSDPQVLEYLSNAAQNYVGYH